MRQAWIGAVALGAAILGPPAAAQTPTADQIIRALTQPPAPPPPPIGRGIRQLAPEPDPAPPPPPSAASVPPPRALPPSAPPPPVASSALPRPATPPPAPPSQVTAAPRPPPPSINLTVNFRSGSAELTPQAVHTLDELGRALISPALAGSRFRIEGHTDTVGQPAANKALSARRAEAVLTYLTRQWSVDRSKLDAVGMGEEQPLVPTGPNVPEPRNRRVTVVNLGA